MTDIVAIYPVQTRCSLQAVPASARPAQSAAQPAPIDRPRSSASSAGAASVATSAKSQPSAKPQPATVVRPCSCQLHMPCITFLLSACFPCCRASHQRAFKPSATGWLDHGDEKGQSGWQPAVGGVCRPQPLEPSRDCRQRQWHLGPWRPVCFRPACSISPPGAPARHTSFHAHANLIIATRSWTCASAAQVASV